ncbi:MAG TPA: hypothetical protein VHE30_13840 [Polyangiaceae bacterium]|nr:hypothetical protein [Polyangiaceae bacterium]
MRRAGLVSLLLLLAGCSDSGPGPGYGSFGYACRVPLDCGPAVSCVERFGGTCWPLCASDLDCGAPYHCKSVNRHGADGHDKVCVPD